MITTNRDIYLHIEGLTRKFSGPGRRTLRDYLKALWAIVSQEQAQQPSPSDLMRWLEEAFTHHVPPSPPAPAQEYPHREGDDEDEQGSFAQWEHRILSQIHELELMRESGQLDDPMRYYGIQAPNGSSWYNFDPFTYLECGVRGTMGGYEEDDVIVLLQDPTLEHQDSPVFELDALTWLMFEELLVDGASYE